MDGSKNKIEEDQEEGNVRSLLSFREQETPELPLARFLEYATKMVDFEWNHHCNRNATPEIEHSLSALTSLQDTPLIKIKDEAEVTLLMQKPKPGAAKGSKS